MIPRTALIISTAIAAATFLHAEPAATIQPTAESQKELTPDSVLAELVAGNEAYILSRVDSRVPVEQVFNQGIGDLFVRRVAGNIETGRKEGKIKIVGGVYSLETGKVTMLP